MPDENRVFDIAKPGKGTPQATSKPVIVGHQPAVNDPMVNEDPRMGSSPTEPTHISVQDDFSHEPAPSPMPEPSHEDATPQSSWNGQVNNDQSPTSETIAPALGAVAATPDPSESPPMPEANTNLSEQPRMDNPPQVEPNQSSSEDHLGHVEGLHISPPKKKSRLPWILLILLGLLIGAYLAIDAGAIKTSIDLPFHVFKQKTTPVATTTAQPKPAATLPAGFTVYQISGTPITFAAPITWGTPAATTDAGYSSRSEGAKSDGTHAYIIDFATNKDVQVAVTSSKYLPAARAVQYYDFLQWCTGTSDNKTYLGVLQFTTVDKVDKATTVSCNQGPINDATKLNSTTIVELNSKSTDGTVFGDLYTKNLTDKEFTVFRVKDKAMKSGSQIKQLLNTIKISATATSSKPAQ
jgi:hypothetical protein